MSAYVEVKITNFTDVETLVTALAKCRTNVHEELTVGNIEYHKEGANLYGYRGDVRAEKANIIIRREHVGNASNDIGFRFDEENKCYYPVISAYDSRTGYGEDWLNKLRQEYATERVVSKLKKSGRKYTLETRDGKRVVTVT